jgi:hypothetical protein
VLRLQKELARVKEAAEAARVDAEKAAHFSHAAAVEAEVLEGADRAVQQVALSFRGVRARSASHHSTQVARVRRLFPKLTGSILDFFCPIYTSSAPWSSTPSLHRSSAGHSRETLAVRVRVSSSDGEQQSVATPQTARGWTHPRCRHFNNQSCCCLMALLSRRRLSKPCPILEHRCSSSTVECSLRRLVTTHGPSA